jgi:hypothetical protein
MAERKTRIVVVEDRLIYTQLIAEAIVAALQGQKVEFSLSWTHSEKLIEQNPAPATVPRYTVVPMSHEDALDRSGWRSVHTVFIDTHDVARDWNTAPDGEERQPVWAGAELARRILERAGHPRVICYSAYLDNPLVKTLLWQQTGLGKATGYYLASSLTKPEIVRSALSDAVPTGQEPSPTEKDYAMAGLDDRAPLFAVIERARQQGERWNVLAGVLPYAEASGATRKWFQRMGKNLGLDRIEGGHQVGRATVDLLRDLASGQRRKPEGRP